MKTEHGTVKNAFITGIGNNTISLLMAIMIFSTVFSVLQHNQGFNDAQVLEVMKTSGPASSGLTFIWLPQLFSTMSFGRPLAVMFFLGLIFAGFTSLISMFELATRVLVDRGIKRRLSIGIVVSIVYLMGIPSVISLDFLNNQDFVWGIGLIISGFFIAILSLKYGLKKLKQSLEDSTMDWRLMKWWDLDLKYFVPVASVLLIVWWLSLTVTVFSPDDWYNPFVTYSAMTCLVQWTGIGLLFVLCNKWLSRNNVGMN
jgi:NSS family neurotransmitter:Na+ symporter